MENGKESFINKLCDLVPGVQWLNLPLSAEVRAVSVSEIALNYVRHGGFNKHPNHEIKVDPNIVARI